LTTRLATLLKAVDSLKATAADFVRRRMASAQQHDELILNLKAALTEAKV
jgi:hypothetical protein